MAFITLQGTLLDPNGSLSIGDELRFTHKSTTGSTLKSAVTLMKLTTLGNYYIDLQYGLVLVEYKDVKNNQFENLGVVTVNQDSAATTLPELLNAIVPPTDAQLLEFQAILADCVSQVTLATTQAVRSETAASVSEAFANQLTTTQLIASTATYAADVSLGTSGFTTSGDGGNGSWKQNGITGQTPSQSPVQLGDALLNDGNGNQWVLVKGVSGDTRKTGASTANSDNYLAIIAMHNSLNDGDTLLIPDGVFLTSAIVTTKRINHVITGELRRSSDTTITDSVLEIQGDRSTLYGGGVVSWNAGAGNDTGRGEAIRLSGDTIYANNITGADTFSGTGNAWYVSGVGCILDSCRGLNSAYAGVRSNMSAVDGDGEPTGQMTITNFVATNCRRGWVNNGFADCITIDNFQVKDLPVNADVQLLGETGEDIRFNKLIMTNTFIHQNLSVDARSLVKFVGIKEVNLTNCDFDVLDSVDVDALTLQNEHAGSETYQENTLNATQCRFRSYNTTVLMLTSKNNGDSILNSVSLLLI